MKRILLCLLVGIFAVNPIHAKMLTIEGIHESPSLIGSVLISLLLGRRRGFVTNFFYRKLKIPTFYEKTSIDRYNIRIHFSIRGFVT